MARNHHQHEVVEERRVPFEDDAERLRKRQRAELILSLPYDQVSGIEEEKIIIIVILA